MTRLDFLQELWASYMAQPPSSENSQRIRHLELLLDEIQQPDEGGGQTRKFVGEIVRKKEDGNRCSSVLFTTASGPLSFSVDKNPDLQQFIQITVPREGHIRSQWEVSQKLLFTVVNTRIQDVQWYVPWDGVIGSWRSAQTKRGKVFRYRIINHWLQLAEYIEYVELNRLIQDRFMVFHAIAPARALDNIDFVPSSGQMPDPPTWLSAGRRAFHDKVQNLRIHYQYCNKQEACDHINRVIESQPDSFCAYTIGDAA